MDLLETIQWIDEPETATDHFIPNTKTSIHTLPFNVEDPFVQSHKWNDYHLIIVVERYVSEVSTFN